MKGKTVKRAIQKNGQTAWFAAALLVAALAIGFFWLQQKSVPVQGSESNATQRLGRGIENCAGLDRNSYGVPGAVFGELPNPPKCFFSIVRAYREKKFSDDFFFSPAFFLQPEFYPNFESQGLSYWTQPVATHWGAVGFGAFPSERILSMKPGSTAETRFFFHSGFGVRAFQGVRFVPAFENPSDAGIVQIQLDEASANGFLLGPSFPKLDANWAKAADVSIRIPENVSPRTITVLFKTAAPGPEQQNQWKNQKPGYFNATDFVGEQTVLRLVINVN